jgi:hypothetical protein
MVSYDTIWLEELSAVRRITLRDQWIEHARQLDERGYFSEYSVKQRREVLRKGFLGRWPPDEALGMAQRECQNGYGVRTPKFTGEMRDHFGLVGEAVREAVLKILQEIPASSYQPPRELADPPGCPFVFHSKTLSGEVYFKFQIAGTAKKPQVLFWSCHPPEY